MVAAGIHSLHNAGSVGKAGPSQATAGDRHSHIRRSPAHPACWQQVRAAQRITGGDHRGKDDGKERGSDAGSNADTDENAPTREPMPIMVAPKMLTSRFNVPAVISVRGSGYLASRSRGTHDPKVR